MAKKKKKMSKGMKEYRYVQDNNIFYEDYRAPSNLPRNSYIKMAQQPDYLSDEDYKYPDGPRGQVEQMDEGVRAMKKQKRHDYY